MSTKIRESKVEADIRKYAESHGCMYLKLAGRNQRGQPDRMIIKHGKILFLEIKRPGEEPEPLQYWWMKKLKFHDMNSFWCDSAEDGCKLINTYVL